MFWKEERRRLADWWDRQHQVSEAVLDVWVENNPSTARIILAGSAATVMRLGSGTVDLLRIGQGIEQGGLKGYGTDLLRLTAFIGPFSRLARFLGPRIAELRLLQPLSADLGVCSWVASTQTMRMTGRLFVTIDDLLKFSGFPNLRFLWANRGNIPLLQKIGAGAGTFLRDIVGSMKIMGAVVIRLKNPTLMQEIEVATATRRNGVVLFNVGWMELINGKMEFAGHTLIGFRNTLGQFRILDRSGHVVRDLAELERLMPGYGKISTAIPYDEMYFVADTIVTQISGALSTVAMEAREAMNKDK